MKYIFILIILLVIIDAALNQGHLYQELQTLMTHGSTLIKVSLLAVAVLLVVLLVYAIIMEWNLLPKLKPKKTLFEIANDEKEKQEKIEEWEQKIKERKEKVRSRGK
ncbi:MAG: hypothetical protein WC218_04405 [Candidatus Cloacimonadales bacterium]|nr:hypothetical protein [Candidatus Cloacimonadota bacterium]